jgi:hypothetical protein
MELYSLLGLGTQSPNADLKRPVGRFGDVTYSSSEGCNPQNAKIAHKVCLEERTRPNVHLELESEGGSAPTLGF